MPLDALARPVIDALVRALERAKDAHLKTNARQAVAEAISELIRLQPDLGKAEARIAVAKAAGILDQDLFTAERMLKKVKKATKAGRKPTARRKPAARKARKQTQRGRSSGATRSR